MKYILMLVDLIKGTKSAGQARLLREVRELIDSQDREIELMTESMRREILSINEVKRKNKEALRKINQLIGG